MGDAVSYWYATVTDKGFVKRPPTRIRMRGETER